MVPLVELVEPNHTAVLTMEMQRGVIGDLAAFEALRRAAQATDMVDNVGRICAAARQAGAAIVHCNVALRPDRQGSIVNCRLLAASRKLNGDRLDAGGPGTANLAELAVFDSDIVVERSHGVTPFVATELDQVLRNCGIKTVVAVGASLNIGLIGMVLGAVDLGYQVVVPSDAVIGVPVEYGQMVLDHTISLLARVLTTAELVAIW